MRDYEYIVIYSKISPRKHYQRDEGWKAHGENIDGAFTFLGVELLGCGLGEVRGLIFTFFFPSFFTTPVHVLEFIGIQLDGTNELYTNGKRVLF